MNLFKNNYTLDKITYQIINTPLVIYTHIELSIMKSIHTQDTTINSGHIHL